jgi:hypothetical protein
MLSIIDTETDHETGYRQVQRAIMTRLGSESVYVGLLSSETAVVVGTASEMAEMFGESIETAVRPLTVYDVYCPGLVTLSLN